MLESFIPTGEDELAWDFIDHVHSSYCAIDVMFSECNDPRNYYANEPYIRLWDFELVEKNMPDVTISDPSQAGVAVIEIKMRCKAHWFRVFT